ncbi:unnamed protein product [Amoebophrya sp. A120]|nr:unnamed protein product [Amoebophrya sp. A120]|eukprot:GSA120T00006787001.1
MKINKRKSSSDLLLYMVLIFFCNNPENCIPVQPVGDSFRVRNHRRIATASSPEISVEVK